MEGDFVKRAEVRPNNLAANLLSFPAAALFIGLALCFVWLHPQRTTFDFDAWLFIGILVVATVVHELVHAVAMFVRGGVPLSAVKFGFNLRAFMPYYHCRLPVDIGAYRFCTMGPFYATLIVGFGTLALNPSYGIALAVGVMLAACAGDLMLYWHLRPFGSECYVQDHPSKMGCDIFTRVPVSAF